MYEKVNPELIAIDGETLALVFMKEKSEAEFFKLAARAKAIVFGRLTPQQKAAICIKTKKLMQLKIVAVGDGFNDTPMIQACDIGVRLVPLNKRSQMRKSEKQADFTIS